MRWVLKRWWFWTGAGFMLVAVCAGYLLIPVSVHDGRIGEVTCNRIQLGTDLWSVLEMLGRKYNRLTRSDGPPVLLTLGWEDEDGNEILVTVERDRPTLPVTAKSFVPTKLSFLELTKRRIERRIKALWP
jgi:hypothetical protein